MDPGRLGARGLAGRTAIAILAATLITALPVAAATPDPVLAGGLFAQNADLHYGWAAGGTPPTAMRTAIWGAADDANATRRSAAPTFTFDAGGGSTVYYGVSVPCGVNGLACFRRDAPTWFGVWLRENGHRFDWGTLRWCEMSGDPDGCYDAENVMLDELGHVTGLDHHENLADDSDYADAVVQTYSRAKPRIGWHAHAFGRCDVATLQQQYDVATTSTPYSTCLEIDTRMTLGASPYGVAPGSVVTFTATLASDGTGRLAGNAMAGRVVVLQRRSGTSWVDALTMGPGATSGVYVASLALRGTGDYRALYRGTATEGAHSSSSVAVTVNVAIGCMLMACAPLVGSAR
jgi:hypothetical protein